MIYTSILQISDRLFQCPRHERFGDPAEQDSQEEGKRQYRMY